MINRYRKSFVKAASNKLRAELEEHQQRVINKLKDNDALLLYHGLGSGKTLSSIAASEPYNKINVVVPAALRENYAKELVKFKADSSKRAIQSYESVINKGLSPADFLILDEAHRLGTSDTKRTQSIYNNIAKHKKRLLLTGTPIRNKPHELAPLSRILDPSSHDLPLAEAEFNAKFITSEPVHHKGFDRIKEFVGLLEPGSRQVAKNLNVIDKAFKNKVDYYMPESSNFPEVKRETRSIMMSSEQADIYRTVTDQANPLISAKVKSNIPPSKKDLRNMNAFITAGRMASNTTAPYGGQEVSNKIKSVVNDLDSMIQENPEHKGIIYSNYIEGGLDQVSKLLAKKNIKHELFTGKLNDSKRRALVNQFNTGETPVLLLSASGSEGLDLKGGRSVQIIEPHWHSSRINQVIGRVVRHKSHEHLPEDQRNVRVINYHSTLPKTKLQELLNKPADTGTDEYLSNMSNTKDQLNNQFLERLRS